jgi:hypothetical protein
MLGINSPILPEMQGTGKDRGIQKMLMWQKDIVELTRPVAFSRRTGIISPNKALNLLPTIDPPLEVPPVLFQITSLEPLSEQLQ